MASAYGYVKEIGSYISPYDTGQLLQMAMYKQDKYDTNAQLINEQISALSGIDLYRDIDQQYLNKRLQTVTAQLNATGADLSSTAITSNIQNYLMRAVDDNVRQAIDSTSRARKDIQAVEAAREANDGSYNIVNAAYTMDAVRQWADSPFLTTKNTRYEGRGYVPYTDVLGETDKLVSEFVKQRGTTTYDTEYGGYIVRRTVSNWTDQELRDHIDSSLSPQALQQLQINGWYKYGNSSESGVQQALMRYADGKDKMYTSEIGLREISLQNLTGDDRIIVESELNSLRNAQIGFRNNIEGLSQNPSSISTFLEREGIVETLVNKYAPSQSLQELKKNEAFFATERLNFDYQKFQTDTYFQQQNLELAQQRLEFERLKFQAQLNASSNSTNGSGSGANPDVRVYPVAVPTDAAPYLDKKEAVLEGVNTPKQAATSRGTELERIFTNPNADLQLSEYVSPTDSLTVSDIYKATLDQVTNELIADGNYTPTTTEIREATLDRLLLDDRSDIIRNASSETLAIIQDYKRNRDIYKRNLEAYNREIQAATTTGSINPDNIYDRFINTRLLDNITISDYGLPVRVKDFLSQNNITNKESFNTFAQINPEQFDEILQTINGYGLLVGLNEAAKTGRQVAQVPGSYITLDGVQTLERARLMSEPLIQQIRNQQDSPNITFEHVFNISENSNGTISINPNPAFPSVYGLLQSTSGQNSNRGSIPATATPTGLIPSSATGGITPNNTGLSQFQYDAFQQFFYGPNADTPEERSAIDKLYGNLPQNFAVQVFAQSDEAKEGLISLLQLRGVDSKGKVVTADPKLPVTLRLDPSTPGQVILEQERSTFNSDGKTVTKNVQASVAISELPTSVLNAVNLESPISRGVFAGAPVPLQNVGNYLSVNEDNNLITYYEDRGVSPQDIQFSTYAGVYQYLQDIDRIGWLKTDYSDALQKGQITQSQYDAAVNLQSGIQEILNNPTSIQLGTHRNNGRTVIDIKIGDFKTSVNTDQRGAEAERLEEAILNNRLVGLTTILGRLMLGSQVAYSNNLGGTNNSDLITLSRIIDSHRASSQKKGQVVR